MALIWDQNTGRSHYVTLSTFVTDYHIVPFLPSFIIPFEQLTSSRPDLSYLQVFRSYVTVKELGDCRTKVDDKHITTDIFLNFSATGRNTIFEDTTTRKIKTACDVVLDEVHFSGSHHPPYAQ